MIEEPGEGPAHPTIEVRSVQVGGPSLLGTTVAGEQVLSGIVKRTVDPATSPTLGLSWINLDGDDQADRTVHGGPDKAVYAYSAEHLASWAAELAPEHDLEVGSGTFGENVTVVGVTEQDVCIGDRWAWGDAVLQICQPRRPCFKLTMRTGVRDIGPRMKQTGRTGWYLRVLRPGNVPVAGPVTVVGRGPGGVTVHEAHLAREDRHREDPARIARVLGVAALADGWRAALEG